MERLKSWHFYSPALANPEGEGEGTHRSERGEEEAAGEDEDEAAAAADATDAKAGTELPAAAAAAAAAEDEEELDEAAATRSERMWIQEEEGGDDAAVGEEEEDGEVEVLDRRRAFMSVRRSVGPSHPPTTLHYQHQHGLRPRLAGAIPTAPGSRRRRLPQVNPVFPPPCFNSKLLANGQKW